MAKRTTTTKKKPAAPQADLGAGEVVASTPVRKTVTPRKTSAVVKAAPVVLTHERIAERAYFISQSGIGGSDHENWLRAEAELRQEAGL